MTQAILRFFGAKFDFHVVPHALMSRFPELNELIGSMEVAAAQSGVTVTVNVVKMSTQQLSIVAEYIS